MIIYYNGVCASDLIDNDSSHLLIHITYYLASTAPSVTGS